MGEMTKAEEVIAIIETQGISLMKACQQVDYKHNAFLAAIKSQGLIDDYARAREVRADMIFDELMQIADEPIGQTVDEDGNTRLDSGWQQHKKQRIDTRKWVLARMNPKKYGDRIETVVTEGRKLPDWMKEGDE